MIPLRGAVIVIFITKDWLDEHHKREPKRIAQITVAKDLNRPVILMIDQKLTPAERQEVDNLFPNHNLTKITFDPDNVGKSAPEIEKALDSSRRTSRGQKTY